MGIKEVVRPLLPPTSRAFLRRTDELSDAINQQCASIQEMQSDLERLVVSVDSGNAETRSVAEHIKYVNFEYLAKLCHNASDILLAGWYGAENLGDELMLQAVLSCFPENALNRVSVLLWNNYHYPIDLVDPRVTILHYPNSTWELDQLANHFSTLVWGGGAILDDKQFDDNPDNTNTGNLFIRLTKLMIARGKRVFSLGLSSNDVLSDNRYLSELNAIVDKSALFSLRDPNSKTTLECAGINTANIELCEDLAFASEQLASLPKHTSMTHSSNRIAVVPLSSPGLFEHYRQVLAQFLNEFAGRAIEVHLVPFVNNPQDRDIFYCGELAAAASDERIVVEPYCHSIRELHFERYDAVVAYKYHAALISLVQETPTICVYTSTHPHYRNKVCHLASLFSNESHLFSSAEFENSAQGAVVEILSHPTSSPKPCEQLLKSQRSWLQATCEAILE